MRATITIPDDLFKRADRAAEELGVSRSRLYQEAMERYLRALRDGALTRQANEAVARYGQPAGPELRRHIKSVWSEGLGDEEW
jgi:metal-responsive CopG/Arc/MetJ family transcriptional regulator